MNKRIKILSSTIALLSVGISTTISTSLISNNLLNTKNTNITNSQNIKNDETIQLVPAQANGQNANISTKAGPVTFNGNTITALDWYGNELWKKDMSELTPEPSKYQGNASTGYRGSWRRAWYNWDYNRNQNILWVLGYGYLSSQSIFGLNADNGNVIYKHNLGYVSNGVDSKQSPYRFVTALSSGKVLIYGDPSKPYDGKGLLYDPINDKITLLTGNSYKNLPSTDGNGHIASTFRWYFYNLIPLANNKNLVEVVAFDTKTGTTGDESSTRASYNVYGILVDDNLDFIGDKQNSNTFNSAYKLADGIKGFRNTTITPKRDYFTLLNNQTVSVTYNTVTLFDTKDPDNIKINQVKMSNPKIIQTWTVDSNDNLYFKFLSDVNVYKVDGNTLKSGNTNFSPITYLDLSSVSNEKVKKDASNFVIYNVYGYTGQLMMIDASYNDGINIYDDKLSTNSNPNYGLAIAVTANKNQNSNGDFLGVLNGSDSIQKSADFTINQNILNSKIPSEITKDNISLENGAFFKSDDPKPVVISNIDDGAGTFTVTANLYKIPWFSTELPKDSVPKTITYKFDTSGKGIAKKISDKVSWKTLNSSTDYDFMNMLPSNVKQDDLNILNPFQVSFQSQTIIQNGKQIYPRTDYSVINTDNSSGKIKIQVKYSYVPMNANYIDGNDKTYVMGGSNYIEKQVLTHTETHDYTIFNEKQTGQFMFMGSSTPSKDNETQTINVNNVPQLKNLLTAGTLPSSFDYLNNLSDSTNSSFLPFINTSLSKGYPISKMKFSVSSDDTNGTLTITATMPSQYSPDKKDHTYSIKYTGLNQKTSYSFNFKSPTTIDGVSIKNILPSSVDEGQIIKNFIDYKGFYSNDFSVMLTPDDKNGNLNVQIKLNPNYANVIGNQNGFTNYTISQNFTGFMTTNEYNSRFSIDFKGDDDAGLLDLKNIQAKEIETAFTGSNPQGITIKNVKYNTLNDFVKGLLVSSTGSSIPTNWDANSGVTTNVYVDNNLGIASFYINIKKDKVPGATSDLNFAITYSGFVKGNQVSTDDNLSFVSDKMLKNYLLTTKDFTQDQIDKLTPNEFATWATNNINKLITYKTGEYKDKLDKKDGGYTLTVTPNSIQSTVTITINFGQMKDNRSLSEYTVQYSI